MRRIRIGTKESVTALQQADLVVAELGKHGFEAEMVLVDAKGELLPGRDNEAISEMGQGNNALETALLRGDVDMVLQPLAELPTIQPTGLVIAGVSERENPAEALLIHPNAVDNQLFKLKTTAKVGASCARQRAQLHGYRPDLNIIDAKGSLSSQLELLQGGGLDAMLFPLNELPRLPLDFQHFTVVPLNVKEFVPAPGQGVFAYQCCLEDMETRRLVKHYLHQSGVSAVTNVERKVLKLLGGQSDLPLGVYCEQDASGNYHVWAAFADAWDLPVKRVRFSQTTYLGFAERVVAGLGANG